LETQASVIAGLEAADFRPIFETVKKNLQGNVDWQEQVDFSSNF
jgi:hypothetical protein